MKISIAILIRKLQNLYSFTYKGCVPHELNLERPIYYNNGDDILSNKVYICQSCILDNIPKSTLIISIGPTLRDGKLSSDNVLELEKDISPFEIFNTVQSIFDIYDEWDSSLQKILNEDGTVQSMIDCSFDVFNNPILLQSADFTMVAYSEIVNKLPDVAQLIDSDSFFEYINLFKLDHKYNAAKDLVDPFIFPSHVTGRRSLCINLFNHGKYSHRIIVSESLSKLHEEDAALLEHFSQYIKLVFSRLNLLKSHTLNTLDTIISGILSKEISDNRLIEQGFSEFDWLPNHTYFCINIKLSSLDVNNLTINSICSRIKSLLKDSSACSYNNEIVVFVNLTKFNTTIDDVTSKLTYFLRDCYLKAGISNSFTGFSEILQYYTQSHIAVDFGIKHRPFNWIYRFDDIAYSYLLECCTSHLPAHLVCSKKILTLKTYDEKNNTQYYHTLLTYLENHLNAVKSAKLLFIHRSTFLYRLERIKEFTNIDFDNKNMLLYILISFKLLDKKQLIMPIE